MDAAVALAFTFVFLGFSATFEASGKTSRKARQERV